MYVVLISNISFFLSFFLCILEKEKEKKNIIMLELFKDYHFNLYSKHVFIDTRQFIYNRAFRSYLCILLQQRFSSYIYTYTHIYKNKYYYYY